MPEFSVLARLSHADVAVHVHHQIVALGMHGVNLEPVQRHFIAGGGGCSGQRLAQQVSRIDLHVGRQLVAEEGRDQEVQLPLIDDLVEAGIAEAYRFAIAKRGQRNLRRGVQGDSQAGIAPRLAQPGVRLDDDHDAVLDETELRVVGVDIAGRLRRAFQVIASVGTAEELLLEGSLQDIAAYFQFHGARI